MKSTQDTPPPTYLQLLHWGRISFWDKAYE